MDVLGWDWDGHLNFVSSSDFDIDWLGSVAITILRMVGVGGEGIRLTWHGGTEKKAIQGRTN